MKPIQNSYNFLLILLAILVFSLSSFGQRGNDGLELLDESLFIGGLSPTVLSKGNVEVNFYSSLFSYNWYRKKLYSYGSFHCNN